MTLRDLAIQLAAREAGTTAAEVSEEPCQQLQQTLHHRYIPNLEAVGWIDRRPEGIVTTEQFPFAKSDGSSLPFQDADQHWDVVAALLGRPHRQDQVSLIDEHDHPVTLAELATEFATHDHGCWSPDETGEGSPLLVRLHHVDLPRLDKVGLIEYDWGEKTIAPGPALSAGGDGTDIGGLELDGEHTGSEQPAIQRCQGVI